MKRTLLIFLSALLILCALAGCGVRITDDGYSLTEIKGDVKCEYRVGKNAAYDGKYVITDAVFGKEEFVRFFNEFNSYDPSYLRDHLDKCDLKIVRETEPDKWNEIFDSEIYIKAKFDETFRGVSVFEYDSRLYFHVLSMGGSTRPEDEGDYFIGLSRRSEEYWRPVIERVFQDAGR